MHRITALVSSLALLAGLFVYAPRSVRAVDPVYIGPGGGSGACSSPLYETDGSADEIEFQAAVNFQDGDIDNVLYVCPGTYDMDAQVVLDGALTIEGVSGAASTILDASESTGRILLAFSALTINGLTFQNAETNDNGGAIYVQTDLIVRNSIFLNNHSFRSGGAIYSQDVVITGSTFTANGSVKLGGAIYSFDDLDLVADSTFSDNTTGKDGGAIYVLSDILDLDIDGQSGIIDSTFSDNEAERNGGAVMIDDDILNSSVVTGNEFSDNVADADANTNGDGGAVFVDDNVDGSVSSNSFTGNSAYDGGAFMIDGDLNGQLSRNRFVSNVATRDGGAIKLDNLDVSSVVTRNQFRDNTAGRDGGGAWLDDDGNDATAAAIVSANTFSGNRAVRDGGGMYVYWTDTLDAPENMTGNTYRTNRAGGIGGGVAIMGINQNGGPACNPELTTREAARVFRMNRFAANRAAGSRQTANVGAVPCVNFFIR
jgi:predicted outer membrane repeat protein